jgi:hypothetical protein
MAPRTPCSYAPVSLFKFFSSGLYGVGYPSGKKTAAGRPPCGRAVWGVAHPQGV